MEWKPIVRSQGAIKTYEARVGSITLWLFPPDSVGPGWSITCNAAQLVGHALPEATDLGSAQRIALLAVARKLSEIAAKLAELVTEMMQAAYREIVEVIIPENTEAEREQSDGNA